MSLITDGELRQVALHLKAALASLELAKHHGTAYDYDIAIEHYAGPLRDLIADVEYRRAMGNYHRHTYTSGHVEAPNAQNLPRVLEDHKP